jgi:preprotein translocase subunit SecE
MFLRFHILQDWIRNAKQFYRDVSAEMRKVAWPNRREVTNTTIIVIIATFVFAGYLFAVDQLAFAAISWIMRRFGVIPPAS